MSILDPLVQNRFSGEKWQQRIRLSFSVAEFLWKGPKDYRGASCHHCYTTCTRLGKHCFPDRSRHKKKSLLSKMAFFTSLMEDSVFLPISLLCKKYWCLCQCTSLLLNPKPVILPCQDEGAYRYPYLPDIYHVKPSVCICCCCSAHLW